MATIVGLFKRYEDADQALHRLNEMGYNKDAISIIASEKAVQGKLSSEEGNTTEGAAAGAVIGGLAGLLFGIGTLLIPGVGLVFTAGGLATILGATATGAGVGAAAGSFRGALAEMGIPDAEAKIYEEALQTGGILITVIVEGDDVEAVRNVFKSANAVDLETRRSIED